MHEIKTSRVAAMNSAVCTGAMQPLGSGCDRRGGGLWGWLGCSSSSSLGAGGKIALKIACKSQQINSASRATTARVSELISSLAEVVTSVTLAPLSLEYDMAENRRTVRYQSIWNALHVEVFLNTVQINQFPTHTVSTFPVICLAAVCALF